MRALLASNIMACLGQLSEKLMLISSIMRHSRNVGTELCDDEASGDEERQRTIARVGGVCIKDPSKQLQRIPDSLSKQDTRG